MRAFRSGAVRLLLGGLVLASGACGGKEADTQELAGQKPETIPYTYTPLQCPNFEMDSVDFQVAVVDTVFRVNLTGGSALFFSPGAISVPGTYTALKGPSWKSGTPPQQAEIEIRPAPGSPDRFAAPVTLRIDYGECGFGNLPRLRILQTLPSKLPQGGADVRGPSGGYVETLIDHLSGYAIVM